MNLNEKIVEIDQRMDKIESTLDEIAKNHLKHIEKYTKWTLIGIIVSTSLSLAVLASTVV